jgi:membrane-bound serine protease (ClpP class)
VTPVPNLAFVLAAAGALGIYAELLRPGRVWPGVVGSISLAIGAYSLWQFCPRKEGTALLAVSAALFLAEIACRPRFLCGLAGTCAMAVGFVVLFPAPWRISPPLAISLSLLLGAVTTLLADMAKKARRNKRADLGL